MSRLFLVHFFQSFMTYTLLLNKYYKFNCLHTIKYGTYIIIINFNNKRKISTKVKNNLHKEKALFS